MDKTLKRIIEAGITIEKNGQLVPRLVGAEFVRFVRQGRGVDAEFAWGIYISRDPCHDNEEGMQDDRWTVLAIHRSKGLLRIIGRELRMEIALRLALGHH